MNRVFALLLLVALCFSLCACETGLENDINIQSPTQESNEDNATVHTHSWASATCAAPKTCTTCGKTEGTAKEHAWNDATCTDPKTCSACGKAEGSAKEHAWEDATCTAPKTCSACGKTEGSAKEHSWKNATCATPKTCSTCGKTTGSISNHTYSNGKCTFCAKQDPNITQGPMVWIPTNGGTKYHSKSSCSGMKNPRQVTKSEAIRQGFTSCKRCY